MTAYEWRATTHLPPPPSKPENDKVMAGAMFDRQHAFISLFPCSTLPTASHFILTESVFKIQPLWMFVLLIILYF